MFKMFLLGLAISLSSFSSSSLPPLGLLNSGNTCYLNSVVQTLYHLPLIREQVVAQDSPLSTLFSLLSSSSSNFSPPVSTIPLTDSLNINPFEQQDSHEFFKSLLYPTLPPSTQSLYAGSLSNYIRPLDPSSSVPPSTRQEAFTDLSLDVSESLNSLPLSLQEFTSPDKLLLSENNGWKPKDSASKIDAEKGSSINKASLPSILLIHLKRFRFDWQRNVGVKVFGRFGLGSKSGDLDLDGISYKLQSVIVHSGEFGSGHYYAYVKTSGFLAGERETWVRCDDDRVAEVSFDDVVVDAFGDEPEPDRQRRKRRFFMSLFGRNSHSDGYGGNKSCAFLLQFVKSSQVEKLFLSSHTPSPSPSPSHTEL